VSQFQSRRTSGLPNGCTSLCSPSPGTAFSSSRPSSGPPPSSPSSPGSTGAARRSPPSARGPLFDPRGSLPTAGESPLRSSSPPGTPPTCGSTTRTEVDKRSSSSDQATIGCLSGRPTVGESPSPTTGRPGGARRTTSGSKPSARGKRRSCSRMATTTGPRTGPGTAVSCRSRRFRRRGRGTSRSGSSICRAGRRRWPSLAPETAGPAASRRTGGGWRTTRTNRGGPRSTCRPFPVRAASHRSPRVTDGCPPGEGTAEGLLRVAVDREAPCHRRIRGIPVPIRGRPASLLLGGRHSLARGLPRGGGGHRPVHRAAPCLR